jgi:hypothetical protein
MPPSVCWISESWESDHFLCAGPSQIGCSERWARATSTRREIRKGLLLSVSARTTAGQGPTAMQPFPACNNLAGGGRVESHEADYQELV